ncbi:MAG: hypothetical protein ACTHMS_15880 [Jatrophihabitans sp.]|uniref:hypothetical protein n=1 Tax=Jatrophihabitans sp. TaxID=1932789 RepID=UPI003F7E1367
MSARPGNWALLTGDGRDPVPGDPEAVAAQARYYTDMASTILAEADRLSHLGSGNEMVGKFAKSLQDDLSKLSGEVRKAHERYAAVGSALGPFAHALFDARDESAGALRDAEAAHAAQQSAAASPNPQATPGGPPLTDHQKALAKAHSDSVQRADGQLQAAQRRLQHALSALHDAGRTAAGKIGHGSDDDLKDHHHWWDVVVSIVKVVVEVANYVAAVAAIAMLFIPGLDLIDLALIATFVAFAGDSFLYATGNASFLDLALDAVGLLTLGMGGAAARSAEVLEKEGAQFAVKYAGRNYKEFAGLARDGMPTLTGSAQTFAREVAADARAGTSTIDRLIVGGDRELAAAHNVLTDLATTFPRSTKLAAYAAEGQRYYRTAQGAWALGSATLFGNLALSPSSLPWVNHHKPYWPAYNDFKEHFVPHSRFTVEELPW